MVDVEELGKRAKEASKDIARASGVQKNRCLEKIALALRENAREIIEVNASDVAQARAAGYSESLVDRMLLNEKRIDQIIVGIRQVIDLPDPVGEVVEGRTLPNGLRLLKVRAPLGVIGIIYEARPNVTVDAAVLCLKAGNAVILRGSSDTLRTNRKLVELMRNCIAESGLNPDAVLLVDSPSREEAQRLMELRGYVDVLIPRGGESLIRSVVEHAKVPVIETGWGNCHVFVDDSADLEMAKRIILNAKLSRPSVCNACESILIHKALSATFLPEIVRALLENGVTVHGCELTQSCDPRVLPATEDDYYKEYLGLEIACKVVSGIDEAIEHVNKYGSRHSDAIVTRSYENANRFVVEVDSAAVYVNASTRFTDGYEFGMGAEIGISTQKLHARGPMALRELTCAKFVVFGDGQIRA